MLCKSEFIYTFANKINNTWCKSFKMDITFSNNKLKKYAENESLCKKKLGEKKAKLYLARIADFESANSLEDVRYLPGHYHELVENRKGQWACDLDQPYRLIFEPHEDPIPTDDNGKYIWIEIKGVEIVEIENYHGK